MTGILRLVLHTIFKGSTFTDHFVQNYGQNYGYLIPLLGEFRLFACVLKI